ncbi:hypothetical protein [Acidocella sp. KAb 2-4]|uniref:hypothetical protein n=1 Tax=Acidocella sp. KAb 2-4 TaxID=2885158 RepID=UPI001D05F6E8|nr:hypothetical protein [Acidocella sp. KAb 2-4]MCB5944257.1 hypothetical protein [Acidocella sp. KAb 2-4]
MSVDLVGSTAFKADKKHAEPLNGSPSPPWIDEFRAFYKAFPVEVRAAYQRVIGELGDEWQGDIDNCPNVWKTIGDEIIFCGRVRSVEHTAASVSAFLKALERYSKRLEGDDKPLRLKGAGWLAAFPAPNISINVTSDLGAAQSRDTALSENTEEFEQAVDTTPSRYDFLGKGIDTGFRIAKNASEDRFVCSVQLGYVLARAATKRKFSYSFGYHGREPLKGVIEGAPYPVVSVDTERSEIKSKLKSREAALTGEATILPHALCDFLETFMEVANIDKPCLGEGRADWSESFPESYVQYQTAFEKYLKIYNENLNQLAEENDPPNPDNSSLAQPESFLLNEFRPAADIGGQESTQQPQAAVDGNGETTLPA